MTSYIKKQCIRKGVYLCGGEVIELATKGFEPRTFKCLKCGEIKIPTNKRLIN